MLYTEIPSLDLNSFTKGNETDKKEFVQKLGEAYHTIGFVAIKNHGLSETLTSNLYESIQTFFSLPEEIKKKYEYPELHGQRGYVGKGKERAKGRSIGDLKEFYHVGQIKDSDEPIIQSYPDNVWPSEVALFEKHCTEAFKTLENTGLVLLRAIALYLGLEETYFEEKAGKGNSILRAIHYFPIADANLLKQGAVRAAEHGDINLITLLMGASASGLEVLRRDGQWIPITALPEQIVVNVGDMLARLTNDKLKSTIHRVVNPPNEKLGTSRFSIPFFMHPRVNMDLTCLPQCVDAEHPKKYEDTTAGEFLHQRLVEIGLIKS